MGKPISLELHHKNGINNDNRLENLQLLCPNCHSYTDNYRGKNIGTNPPETVEPKVFISKAKTKICPNCNSEFTGSNIYCSDTCYTSVRRNNIPNKEELMHKLEELKSFVQVVILFVLAQRLKCPPLHLPFLPFFLKLFHAKPKDLIF